MSGKTCRKRLPRNDKASSWPESRSPAVSWSSASARAARKRPDDQGGRQQILGLAHRDPQTHGAVAEVVEGHGDARLVVAHAANDDALVRVLLASVLEGRPLDGRREVPPRDLQQSDAALDAVDDEVSAHLAVLLPALHQLLGRHVPQVAVTRQHHDGQLSQLHVLHHLHIGALRSLVAQRGAHGARVHDAVLAAVSRVQKLTGLRLPSGATRREDISALEPVAYVAIVAQIDGVFGDVLDAQAEAALQKEVERLHVRSGQLSQLLRGLARQEMRLEGRTGALRRPLALHFLLEPPATGFQSQRD
eukprot:scaffold2177_cov272-Pinguiococcus_pyrenoidosus.AAC.5